MNDTPWPEFLSDLVFIPHYPDELERLVGLAEPEEWDYQVTPEEAGHRYPVLHNYLRYTYKRLAEEDKITVADDGRSIAFNLGLVTPGQEPLFLYATQNRLQGLPQPWHFTAWARKGSIEL